MNEASPAVQRLITSVLSEMLHEDGSLKSASIAECDHCQITVCIQTCDLCQCPPPVA